MKSWLRGASTYREPRILGILFLGFSSGLPFLLTLATLHVWLKEVGINKTTIGLFALVTLPYSLKFVWAPLIDHYKFPGFSSLLGHRKGWMLASQLCLMVSLILLGHTSPATHIFLTALAALSVAFFSATQDIIIEAYRVERLDVMEVGIGAGASNLGYRLGMWVSGAGALYLASYFSWNTVYTFMAFCMIIGMVTTLLSHEPRVLREPDNTLPLPLRTPFRSLLKALGFHFKKTLGHLKTRDDWGLLLAYILLFKAVDTALNIMAAPFLLELGFTKIEIAHVGKSFGIGAMIAGGLLGGLLLSQYPLRKILILGAILHLLSALLFFGQAQAGHNLQLLFATIGIENLSTGLNAAAFITYLSLICRGQNTAANFAFLSSLASLARVFFSYLFGWAADTLSWDSYYLLTAFLCLPNGVLLVWAHRYFHFQQYHSSLTS